MNGFVTSMVTVLSAILGVAMVAVLMSRNSQTPQVTQSFWDGFSKSIGAATAPVTGNMAASGIGSSYGGVTANML